MTQDELFMQRAIDLAQRGHGSVSPNPLVGCVVVRNNSIIGEGWHQKYGEAHAEVNALSSAADQDSIEGSTVYVNLEPCSHFGKTPPCADLLVAKRVARVVIANTDSNPLVSGKGIAKLKAAGIDVVTGVLENSGRELNRRFFTFMEKKRPFVILKWAETADGFIARDTGDSKWISNEISRKLVHRWRTEEDAVLVGTSTAALDDPQLNARDWKGRNPVRIVFDRHLRLDPRLHLFDGSQQTLCYNTVRQQEGPSLYLVKVSDERFCEDVMADLATRNVQSVMVEGGTTTINLFVRDGLWDEMRVFRTPTVFGAGFPAPTAKGRMISTTDWAGDVLQTYVPPSPPALYQ